MHAHRNPAKDRTDLTAERRLYRILVRDLVLKCSIGIHAHERLAPQRVRINVEMAVYEQAGPLSDDIANVVSYEDVIEGIKAMLAKGHINLVETLAENIAGMCLDDGRVDSVRVRVEKPDVYAEAASVGIEIERRRD
ncbi:MAG: dihydroneopterin aldolase [Actinomycetota bacterium]